MDNELQVKRTFLLRLTKTDEEQTPRKRQAIETIAVRQVDNEAKLRLKYSTAVKKKRGQMKDTIEVS